MSLLIKGMDMPKACISCDLRGVIWGNYKCTISGKIIKNEFNRPDDCPLSEITAPHDRLIDADELMKVIEANDYTLRSYYNTTDRGMFTIGIKQAIDEAPTIIEAEE